MLYLLTLLLSLQGTGSPALTVSFGDPVQDAKLTKEALAKLPRKTIKVTEGNGKDAEYEGYALDEILKLAKVPMGNELRGRTFAQMIVIADASDGGRAVYALAEVEPSFSDKVILLADKCDGKALGTDEGPFRMILPSDKRHARWLRQVKGLTVKKL
ncbi:MAG: molybdopterin-dependent oxidoreductase [Gemmatales bacterium]